MIFRKNILKGATQRVCKQTVELNADRHKFDMHNVLQTKRGLGSLGNFEKVEFAPKAIKVFASDMTKQVFVLAEDGLYSLLPQPAKLSEGVFSEGTGAILDRQVIFSAAGKGTYTVGSGGAERVCMWGCKSVGTCLGRLVGVDSNDVRVCAVGDTNLLKAEFTVRTNETLQGGGAVGDVFYALGEACYMYRPNAEAAESRFVPIAHNVGVVQTDTVVALKDKLVFAANGGLKAAKQGKVTDLATIDDLCLTGAVACEFEGRYMLSCKREANSSANDITLVLDDKGVTVGVFEYGFDSLFSDSSVLYAVKNGDVFRFVKEPSLSCAYFGNLNLGCDTVKHLRRIAIRTRNDASVWVHSDGIKRLYFVTGSPATQTLLVNGVGREFALEVQCDDGLDLDLLRIEGYTYEEE